MLALIKADKPDDVVAAEVSDALMSANVNCRVTITGKTMMDWLREYPDDASLRNAGLVNAVSFSHDSKTIATATNEGAQLWEVSTGQRRGKRQPVVRAG